MIFFFFAAIAKAVADWKNRVESMEVGEESDTEEVEKSRLQTESGDVSIFFKKKKKL